MCRFGYICWCRASGPATCAWCRSILLPGRVQQSVNRKLEIEGVLLTMYDGRTNLSIQVANEVKKHFRGKVFTTIVPRTVRLGEAPSHGQPIHLYDPRSAGTEAYRNLAQELLRRTSRKG